MLVAEIQMQGSKDQASGSRMQGSKDQASDIKIPPLVQLFKTIPPYYLQVQARCLVKSPTLFVYELVKEVVTKFVTLAILEETLEKYQSMVYGQIKISESYAPNADSLT